MTTIIVGDIAEGEKHWSTANFLKTELKRLYEKNNAYMETWKQVDAGTKIWVKMVNGQPKAFIFSGLLYEFSRNYDLSGLKKYFGTSVNKKEIVLRKGHEGWPVNVWYSKTAWVTGGFGYRYSNPRYPTTGTDGFEPPIDVFAQVYNTPGISYYTSPEPVIAAAIWQDETLPVKDRRWYCHGINTDGFAYVWDIASKKLIASQQVTLSVPMDSSSYVNAAGFWSFNRAGNRAVSSVWVSQYDRFNPDTPRSPVPKGWLRSYVVEVEFVGDGTFLVSTKETPNLCLAADYDWTVLSNPIILYQETVFNYSFHKAREWLPSTMYSASEYVKVVLTDGATPPTRTNGHIYKVVGVVGGGGMSGTTPPTHYLPDEVQLNGGVLQLQNVTYLRTAHDVWARLTDINDNTIVEVEQLHNRDGGGYPDTDQWYQIRPANGIRLGNLVNADDLRVRGRVLGASTGLGVRIEVHYYSDRFVYLGDAAATIPDSAGEDRFPPNAYMAVGSLLLDPAATELDSITTKFFGVNPAVAAVPNIEAPKFKPKELAVYLNTQYGDLDKLFDSTGAVHNNYHTSIGKQKDILGNEELPASSVYRLTGAWATTLKDPKNG